MKIRGTLGRWPDELMRALAELDFFVSHKLLPGPHRSILMWKEHLLAQSGIEQSPTGGEELDSGDWARRYFTGVWDSRGYYGFSIPQPYRLEAIHSELQRKDMVPHVAIMDHSEPVNDAKKTAVQNGFDLFGDIRILSGTVRGIFYGVKILGKAVIESILIILHVRGEPFWRIREVRGVYRFLGPTSDHQLAERIETCQPHDYRIRDGFAAFGTTFGAFFNVRDAWGRRANFSVSNFSFRSRGRRIKSFEASDINDAEDGIEYRLYCDRQEVERSVQLLRNFDLQNTLDKTA